MSDNKYYLSLKEEFDPWRSDYKNILIQVHTYEDLMNSSSIWAPNFLLNNLDKFCCLDDNDSPVLWDDYIKTSNESSSYSTEIIKLKEISKLEYLENFLIIKLYEKVLNKF